MNDDELFAELAQLRPDLDADKLAEARSLPAVLRGPVLQQLVDQDWTPPSETVGQRVVAIVAALGGVAGAVAGVAGAVSGVKGAV